jgi:aminopeptidase YwaD
MYIRIFGILVATAVLGHSQAINAQSKADKKTMKQIQADIEYLASDDLEGRRTGTKGESIAADYIVKQYRDAGIMPYKGEFYYPFHFVYGKEIAATTKIKLGKAVVDNEDAFPMPFSANKHVSGDVLPDMTEQGSIWLVPLYADADKANDPHAEVEKDMYNRAKEMQAQGATGVLFYDGYGSKWAPSFNKHSEYDPLNIPVAFISATAYQKYIAHAGGAGVPVDVNVSINKSERTGNNLAAYMDNGARYTVIVGAHYDHLGYGEDGNSLLANAVKEHQIHHGADDNASGTAAVLAIAKWVKKEHLTNYNYLFLNFSGEELGLYGSKAFAKDQAIDSAHVAYMMNLDMVGRLNDSTRALTLGGVGTSPVWSKVVEMGKGFKLVIDSSGVGPSDHTTFYNVGIPVLFFFTGTHRDYHKPSDLPNLINYKGEMDVVRYAEQVLSMMDENPAKPGYLVTKQPVMGKTSFKVTLGIMPDYTYETGGVRVDGVSENRPAIKAGIKQGDIIINLGDYKISGMQTYMEALGKFSPGDKTQVTIVRDGKQMTLPIELNK